eukprot:jgi/Chlat1/3217/Chrsp22S03496
MATTGAPFGGGSGGGVLAEREEQAGTGVGVASSSAGSSLASGQRRLAPKALRINADGGAGPSAVGGGAGSAPIGSARSNTSILLRLLKCVSLSRTTKLWFACNALLFIDAVMYAIVAPFLSLQAEKLNASSLLTGITFSIYSVAVMLGSAPAGLLSARLGRRTMMAMGVSIVSISCIFFGLVPILYAQSSLAVVFTLFIVCRGAQGLGASCIETSSMALLCDTFPDSVGSVMGTAEACMGAGLMAGAPLGGILYEWGGFSLPFLVTGSLPLFLFLFTYSHIPFNRPGLHGKVNAPLSSILSTPMLVTCLAVVLNSAVYGFLDVAVPPRLANLHNLKPYHIGFVFGVMALVYTLSSIPVGRLSDRVRRKYLIAIGCLMMSIGFWGIDPTTFLPVPSLYVLLSSMMLIGMGSAVSLVPVLPHMLDCVGGGHENVVNAVSGLFGSAYYLGEAIGPIMGSALTDAIGFKWGAAFFGSLCATSGALILLPLKHRTSQAPKSPVQQLDIDSSDDKTPLLL